MRLHNRNILITGATSGIGKALARRFAAMDNHVIAVGRSAERLAMLEKELPRVTAIRSDLSCKGDVIALGQRIHKSDQRVSVLINNAAVQFTPRFTDADFSFDSIETEITTNFTATAWLTSLFLPHLIDQEDGAAIVNMSSGLAIHPKTSSAIYCATKAALHSLSQSLRYQLEGTSVRILEVLLPLVDTPMTEGRGAGKITAGRAADETIAALMRGRDELYIGKSALVPLLDRISPVLAKRVLRSA